MNILIVEDEIAAARQIQRMICDIAPTHKILAIVESVREGISWITTNAKPDLIICDIELADGISFEIFKQVRVDTPVIFTTAYNTYMQRAFKVNSIDYLLKPIDKEELAAAFAKHKTLSYQYSSALYESIDTLLCNISVSPTKYKNRFLVKYRNDILTIPLKNVAFLMADDRIVFLFTQEGKKYILDNSLEEIEKRLDPNVFFRLNRRYIAPIDSIKKIHTYFNGRLKIELKGSDDSEIIVSKEKATLFKKWLDS